MIRLSAGAPLVEIERSGVVESRHSGHLIVLAADGSVRLRAGNPDQPVFARSSLKPLQAVGLLRAGLTLDDTDLALAAASHSGGVEHRTLITAELAAAGLAEDDLACPASLPLGEDEQRAYLAAGLAPARVAMNCSGKHTAMLRTCVLRGWPVSGYLDRQHPLQRQLADTVAELTGDTIAATGVDGCGAPLFAITLSGLARAFARLAVATDGPEHRVATAMRRHPELVAGPGRSATRLMQGVAGLIAKDGAEGVYAAALADGGAVAVKIDDGATRAADVAVATGLAHLGVRAAVLDELANQPVLGGGVTVGTVRPVEQGQTS